MYRSVSPPRAVDMRRDAQWYPGSLQAWRRRDGRWQGYVHFTVGVGMRHVAWVDATELRRG